MSDRVRIGDLLVAAKLVTEEQVQEALVAQRESGRRLGEELVAKGFVTEFQLTQILSNQLSIPWVSLQRIEFTRELLNMVPAEVANRLCVIPIYMRRVRAAETLYVAMDDPTNEHALEELVATTGLPVKAMVSSPSEIRHAIRVYYLAGAPQVHPPERRASRHPDPNPVAAEPVSIPKAPPTGLGETSVPASADEWEQGVVTPPSAASPARPPAAPPAPPAAPKPPVAPPQAASPAAAPSAPAASASAPATSAPVATTPAGSASAAAATATATAGAASAPVAPPAGAASGSAAVTAAPAASAVSPASAASPAAPAASAASSAAAAPAAPAATAASSAAAAPARPAAPAAPNPGGPVSVLIDAVSKPPVTRVEDPPTPPATAEEGAADQAGVRMVTLTLLDGTTVRLPAPGSKRQAAEQATEGGLTASDLVSALIARAQGADVSDVLPDKQWEILFASLLTLLIRKGLLADWEFVEEWKKRQG